MPKSRRPSDRRSSVARPSAVRGRVVVVRDDLPNAVAEPDVLRLRGGGAEEYLGCGGVRIFVQKVVFDFPCVVEAQSIRQRDLLERILEQTVFVALVPGAGKLQLVENAESHVEGSLKRGTVY